MRFSAWFTVVLAFSLGLSLSAPVCPEAATRDKTVASAKKDRKVSGKSSRAGASSQKSRKVAKKSSRKEAAPKKSAKSGVAAALSSERDVWLKRARSSDALTGKASWYGKDFHNKATASGLAYDMHTFTAAHRTLPLGTVVKVTDQHNGKSVMVCVTDRGPYVAGRIIDISAAAASKLDLQRRGVGKVKLEVVSDENGAPLKKDAAYFVRYASGAGKSMVGPFKGFADAAAMHEALRQAHPDAEVVLGDQSK